MRTYNVTFREIKTGKRQVIVGYGNVKNSAIRSARAKGFPASMFHVLEVKFVKEPSP